MTSIPREFIGGISLETMINPINLGCHESHNFDRQTILTWFRAGHDSCPLGRAEVDPDLISYNENLSERIRTFTLENPTQFEDQIRTDLGQPKNRDLLELKVELLRVKEERTVRRIQEVGIALPGEYLQYVSNIGRLQDPSFLGALREVDDLVEEPFTVRRMPALHVNNRYNDVIDMGDHSAVEEEDSDPESREIDYPDEPDYESDFEDEDAVQGYDVEEYMVGYAERLREDNRPSQIGSSSAVPVIPQQDLMRTEYLSDRLALLREFQGNIGNHVPQLQSADSAAPQRRHIRFIGRELEDIGLEMHLLGQNIRGSGSNNS
ncbi:MAG: hypothetical protein ACI9S8_001973 [Chlamydiales bacterium]|jgi:hypothetical protein